MPILASFIKAGAAVMQILQVPYPFSNSKYPFLLFVLHPTEKKTIIFRQIVTPHARKNNTRNAIPFKIY